RHDLVAGESRADRRHQQRDRPLHPRPGRQQGDLWRGDQLGLTYYFYPSGSTQLSVGFVSSANGGSTWSTPQMIASGMSSTWTATTSQGRMVGDYISTSYGSGQPGPRASPPPPNPPTATPAPHV